MYNKKWSEKSGEKRRENSLEWIDRVWTLVNCQTKEKQARNKSHIPFKMIYYLLKDSRYS